MPSYLHPGVYMEEIPSGVKTIEAVGTSTAVFIGYTVKGPISDPTFITKWDQYDDQFGGLREPQDGDPADSMGHSVYNFFLNGGAKAYIVRLATGTAASKVSFIWAETPEYEDGKMTIKRLTFTVTNGGTWGDDLNIRLTRKAPTSPELYTFAVGTGTGDDFEALETIDDVSLDDTKTDYLVGKVNNDSSYVEVEDERLELGYLKATKPEDTGELAEKTLTLTINGDDAVVNFEAGYSEEWADVLVDISTAVTDASISGFHILENEAKTEAYLTVLPKDGAKTSTVAHDDGATVGVLSLDDTDGSASTTEALVYFDALPNPKDFNETSLADGNDGSAASSGDYDTIYTKLLKIRDINIILLPDKQWDSTSSNLEIANAIKHCEQMQNRMVIIDPQSSITFANEAQVKQQKFPTSSTYTALYYPWVTVSNPFYNADTNPKAEKTLSINPSAFAAGMWAKIADRRGVWKAPAGVETGLLGLSGLEAVVEDAEQDYLNPLGVNALRTLPGYGSVIWGSRTLATKVDPEWRYIPVRRTAMFIKDSLFQGIQWAVFEPNSHRLWSALRTNIDSFMNGLFRVGAFQGEKASDAYFVRCGLGDTMTQGDIDRGQVIVIVGFAPLKPAEFVIVRLQQKVGQQ